MSVISKPIRKAKFRRDLLYWLCLWVVPIGLTIMVYATIIVNYPADVDAVRMFNTILLLVWMVSGTSALLMVPVVFLEWFPPEYYDDLQTCPVCGEDELKVVDDSLCFNCGATKKSIEDEQARADPKANL